MPAVTPELVFAGFRTLAAAADDPLLAKWRAVRPQLDCGPLRDAALVPGADLGEWNLHVNRVVGYLAEAPGADVWQTPAVTLARLAGDCEDIAILKYALLAAAGVPEPSLRIVVGRIISIAGNQDHAWLALFRDGAWHALDCKFDPVKRVTEYLNWLPVAAVHADTGVIYGREFSIDEILGRTPGLNRPAG
jgi:transglutaminase-like putative cysteine protease